jgi:hypothetical protein
MIILGCFFIGGAYLTRKLNNIQRCCWNGKLLYTRHAMAEMRMEEFGKIREQEVFEAITCGEIIEEYENGEPYPSMLIYGRAQSERPLHIVCAYSEEDDLAIVITAYPPDPKLWMDYRRRKRR